MAKKADLLAQAKDMDLKVTDKNTIAEIEAAIKQASSNAEAEAPVAQEEKHAAKAGKRSEKSLREAEEKVEKEARKAAGDTTPTDPEAEAAVKKGPAPKTRSKLERRGKKFQEAAKKIEAGKAYTLAEALKLATETNPAKFDASVEIHVRMGVDPRQADQNIRATVSLPNGSGKTVRVAAFVPSEETEAVKKAGADVAGEDEVASLLDKEKLDFDVLVATPQLMPKLGKYARLLGPRGLMPNPKSGTVATNAAQAVKEAKGGRVEYRVDKQSVVHLSVGKVSFGADKLDENARSFFSSLNSVKPSSLKGAYIQSVNVTTTMGPGIKVDSASL
ncbi:MAG TPA: 50S ribosomal protein L1 [Candidatus Saccharimonadales bacterium]|nr:50S ribosomal protein L1 [Candidatus Saccharimonadales bacterium]